MQYVLFPKFVRFVDTMCSAPLGVILFFAPALMYGTSMRALPIERAILCFGLCLMPLVLRDAWHAKRALERRNEQVPMVLGTVLIGAASATFWLPYVAQTYGNIAYFVMMIFWPIACLSLLGFIVAASQVEADATGHRAFLGVVYLVHNLGGFFGVGLAKRTFKDSPIAEELPNSFPTGVPLVVAGIFALVFLRGLPTLPVLMR
jgi:hypothetical protein